MSEEGRFPKVGMKSSRGGFRGHNSGNRNGNEEDRGFCRSERFHENRPHPARKKKRKGKELKNKVDALKKREEYSHLLSSLKLTVFDWDCTLVLRNLPANVEVVKTAVERELKDISIKKYCPIKRTFKSRAVVTLGCVLNKRSDVDSAISRLSNLKIGDFNIIASRFARPYFFSSNPFSACILNFPDDASEKELSVVLNNCGVTNSIDVEYSESGALKKVLVNLTNSSDLALLLDKNGMQVKSGCIKVVPIKASCSIIVGNVGPKMSNAQLGKIFGENVLLVHKMRNMFFQIFFEDEERAVSALRKNGNSIRNHRMSVRPWSKENMKQYQVFVSITGNPSADESSFDINEFLSKFANECSVTPIKKKRLFVAMFETKEGQKAALDLTGSVFNGWTVEVTKKRPSPKKIETEAVDGHPLSNTGTAVGSVSEKKHVYFE